MQADIAHELDAPPWHRVEATLMHTSRAIRRAYDIRLEDLDLNLTQASLLGYVDHHGPATQIALADRLGIGRAATGTIIDGLSTQGLILRRADPSDGRAWLIQLTASGREIAAEVARVDKTLREELRSGVTRADRQQLARTLVRIQENLASVLNEDSG